MIVTKSYYKAIKSLLNEGADTSFILLNYQISGSTVSRIRQSKNYAGYKRKLSRKKPKSIVEVVVKENQKLTDRLDSMIADLKEIRDTLKNL